MNVRQKKDKDGKPLTKDGKPVWRLRWETKDPGKGERVYLHETFHGSRRKAEDRWTEREAEILAAGARYTKPSKESLADYLHRWLQTVEPDVRDTTLATYDSLLRVHVIPALGAVPLADLTPTQVQRLLDEMRAWRGPDGRSLSTRTVGYTRTVLRRALADAVRLGTIRENPADRTRGPKQTPRRVTALTLDELDTLFARAETTRLAPLLRFAAFSGLRRGEILGLRWEDVDLGEGRTVVRRQRVAVRGKAHTHDPKTDAGVRSVALPAAAVDALRAQRLQQKKDRLAAGATWQDAGWVFTTAAGGPLSPNNVSRDYRRLRTAAGLPPEPFHALRHSAVSMQLAAGVPVEVVSKRIGHKNLATTTDTYGHLLPEADRAAAERLDAFLAARGTLGRGREQ